MKILWVNPAFLDYRIPLYKEVYNLADKDFYLIYSENRVYERYSTRISQEIGIHAMALKSEKVYTFGNLTEFSNSGVRIPYPKGYTNLLD